MPLYVDIMNNLLDDISSKKFPPGTHLPTEKELTRKYNASTTSVRRALKELQIRNCIEKRQGSGSYVRDTEMKPVNVNSMLNIGLIINLKSDDINRSSLLSSFSNNRLMGGIKKVFDRLPANLTLTMYHQDSDDPWEELNKGFKVDGFIDLGNTISEKLDKCFTINNVKVVSIFPYHNQYMFNYANPHVIMDERDGIRKALKFYTQHNAKTFGYVGLAENGLRNYRIFQDILKREKIFFHNSCVIIHPEQTGNLTNMWERVQQIYSILVNSDTVPDVIFFDGGKVADQLLKLVIEEKPELAKKITFCTIGNRDDDFNYPELLDFIAPQYQVAGETAAELLLKFIKRGKVSNKSVSVPSLFIPHNGK